MVTATLEWSAIRPVLNAFQPRFHLELAALHERTAALVTGFVDASLVPALPDLKKLNAAVRKECDEAQAANFPEHAVFLKAKTQPTSTFRSRVEKHPEKLGFDPRLVQSALSWLHPDFESSFSRAEVIAVTRVLLEIVLGNLPLIKDSKAEEIGGLPSDFDSWVFQVIAAAIPAMALTEKPRDLWEPILVLGPAFHQWVERFFWQWFTIGSKARPEFGEFFAAWRAMIDCALTDPRWDPKVKWHHEIAGVVVELLGFDTRWSVWIATDGVGPYIAGLNDLYGRAAARWFSLPKVLSGFARFAQQDAASSIAIPSIPWIAAAVKEYRDYDWRDGAKDVVTEFLGACWNRNETQITADVALRTALFEIVRILAARGDHAALALQDRINSRRSN